MQKSLELLRWATLTFPLVEGRYHNLTLENGKLKLTILINNIWNSFIIDEEDFDREPKDIINEINSLLNGVK